MASNFHSELKAVEQLLFSVPPDLGPPLHDLVASQLETLSPYPLASFVLAAGAEEIEQEDNYLKRVNLAAALETLYLALNIHKHILEAEPIVANSAESEFYVGSMILAGDFCFSRSAEFAANTDVPKVVEIFSDVLKRVSEGHLRQLHDKTRQAYDEVSELIMAGVHAAMELRQLNPQLRDTIIFITQELAAGFDNSDNSLHKSAAMYNKSPSFYEMLALLSVEEQSRWQKIIDIFIDRPKS